ncbi:hypothetical protein FSHL1_006712 [Fusarium sambucinum]
MKSTILLAGAFAPFALAESLCEHNGAAWHVEWNWSGGQDSVKSYPNSALQIGSDKKIIRSIINLQSTAEWTYSGNNIRADSGEYELMVWLARYGEVQPISTRQTSVTIEGHTWELRVSMNGSMKVFSFIAPTLVNDFNADIKQLYDYFAKSQNYPAGEQYLLAFQLSTEPFTGENAKFSVTNFNAHLK